MQRRARKLTQLIVVILLLCSLAPQVWAQTEQSKLTIRHFNLESPDEDDTKNGDSMLITTPDGQNLLIDAKMPHNGPELVARLKELGVDYLDYAFVSHPHIDHIGGYITVLEEIGVGKFYQINVPYTTSSTYNRVQALLEKHKVDTEFLEAGDVLEVGDITFTVFNPPKGTSPETTPNAEVLTSPRVMNDFSLVMRLDYKDFSMLFTGDIYMAREMELVVEFDEELQADILDAPHHGGTTSSSSLFINTVMPQYVIMNHDGTFSVENFEKYRMYDVEVFVTAVNGEILIVTDGQEFEIITERDLPDYLLAM